MYRQTLQSGIVPYGQGDITSSEMDFSLVAYDTSDSEGPSIQAFVYFNWINLIVQYAHQVFAITGGSVGISVDIFEREAEVNVSLDVSSAYDTSPQRPHKFLY